MDMSKVAARIYIFFYYWSDGRAGHKVRGYEPIKESEIGDKETIIL